MNRICRHALQVQEKWIGEMATGQIVSHVEKPEEYTCGWALQFQLPPPVARWVHAHEIRSGDCETCPLYQPPDVPEIMKTKAA